VLSPLLSDGPGFSLLLLLISLPVLLFLLRLVSLPLLPTAGSLILLCLVSLPLLSTVVYLLLLLRLVPLPLLPTAFLLLFSLFLVTCCLLLNIEIIFKEVNVCDMMADNLQYVCRNSTRPDAYSLIQNHLSFTYFCLFYIPVIN
jgi:hypothetical protein